MWARALTSISLLLATPSAADTLIAKRTIRSQAILGPEDVAVIPETVIGALISPDEALGQEARVVLYAGRPIMAQDVGPPAIVERNQIVPLTYAQGGLRILAEGRSLGRAGVGDTVRVMNLASKTVLSGRVTPDGSVSVSSDFSR